MSVLKNYQQIFSQNLPTLKSAERKFRYSDTLLFREYQTRLFLWKRTVSPGFEDAFNKSKLFHNLFIDLFPSGIADFISEETVTNDLENAGIQNVHLTRRDYYGLFVCLYINWEIFKEMPEIVKFHDLPHPYEPVFKMLLRGGFVFNPEKIFEIDERTYLKYDNKFTIPSLENKFLDFIDENVASYPNQEKVDELWDIYKGRN